MFTDRVNNINISNTYSNICVLVGLQLFLGSSLIGSEVEYLLINICKLTDHYLVTHMYGRFVQPRRLNLM